MNDKGFKSPESINTNSSTESWLFPTIILIVLLVGLSLLGYYYINQQVIQPLNKVTLQLNNLEAQFAASEQVLTERFDSIESDVAEIQTELAALDARLASVETTQQAFAETQEQQGEELVSLQTKVTDFDRFTDDIQTINDMKELIQTGIASLQGDVTSATTLIEQFEQSAATLTEEVSTLGTRWQELQNEVDMLRVTEIINRSRTLLSQGNIAQARIELQAAQQMLEELRGKVADYQVDALEQITASLDQALKSLSTAPASALSLIENAWNQLISVFGEK